MQKHAFTLLELMIVVIIVGILASLAMPMFQGAMIKARIIDAFRVMNFFDKIFDIVVMEYGTDDLQLVYDKLYEAKAAESFISTEHFNYDTGVLIDRGYIVIRCRPRSHYPSGEFKFLLERRLYPDEKIWVIYDSSPWAKYLNIPGAEHLP